MANSVDRANEYAEKNGLSQQKQVFKHVKQGNMDGIIKIMRSPGNIRDWEQVFGDDLAFARASLEYSWSQACLVAIQEEIPEREVYSLFIKNQQSLWEASKIKQVLELNTDFYIQLVQRVREHQREAHYSLPIQVARSYIRGHAHESLTVSSVAAAIGYSRSHLSHIYRQETGETVYGFIQREKLGLAEQLLLTFTHPMADIWRELGFCSQSHFTTFFRKLTGVSPHEYRQKAKAAITASGSNEETTLAAEPSLAVRLSFKDQSPGYQETLSGLLAYAEEIGFKQEMYLLYCVKRGRTNELAQELADGKFNKPLSELFGENRALAYQTFMFILPQVHGAATDGGLGMKAALRLYMSFFERAQEADTPRLLELNREAFIAFADAVCRANEDASG